MLKTVLSGGSSLSVGIKEKAESSQGLPFMVKEFVPVSIFNFCGSAILIDYISFNMAELILPLSGARSIKRMVNIWSNRTHILINYRWYELFISNAGKNFEKTPSNIDDLLYYPQFSAVNIIFPIWKMKVRRVFLFDVSKPKSWKCVGIWDFFVILNNWNSILFVYCWHTKCFHHRPLSRSHSWINNYRPVKSWPVEICVLELFCTHLQS